MLIEPKRMMWLVFGYVLIVFLVVVGPLAYVAGADSRIDEHERRLRRSA